MIPFEEADPVAMRRLKWRARRGLLENDIIISRFLEHRGDRLGLDAVLAFEDLLELPDNELLDLLLARTELPPSLDRPTMQDLLAQLRTN